ncbi:hypothetical protein B7P43_G18264, partial [Cryptotermes secundus]
ISTYHKEDMRVVVNKANKDQMLQPYLLERNGSTKWYQKLFKRLLNVAIHNVMVIYRCLPNNKIMGTLKFRLSLAQGLLENYGSGFAHPIYGRPSVVPLPKRLAERHFLECIPVKGKKQSLKKDVWCAQNMVKGKNLFTGVVNVRQGCG